MEDSNIDINFTKHLNIMKAGEWEKQVATADYLASLNSQKAVELLISLLDNANASIRNAAALGLRTAKKDYAVAYLLQAIENPNNVDDISTLVYSLETHDCSHHFLRIFKILTMDNVAATWSVLEILNTQAFYVDEHDIHCARQYLQDPHFDADQKRELENYLDTLLASSVI